ncbi:MAG: hypothetical protein A3I88_01380 [Candidatus Portnoybacteria bacterium RIFCSPLOWO2_12_FULL_39_9]|uniref:Nmd3 N-terminal domain-containing protein n=1 Tax=Candidatus Portnoybacteria bacterium RIFCSPHIGHO2_12_FULL_38_9 TaxID=1801997 RepID=A0A1G2FHK9_9BACT|nr:MAG: hypothetical protein A3H00_01435 [Candidatus Portnoybacteria bacterium RBG_13_40_8]OGZ36632.1 MAG: hypothetical protein A2646_00440 [Candidatus Portnoybacteria bacterium RIFCSPHIGHO2_02_FULL_39_12]OGZ37526.1 MAG: hypothetical protein A3J64_00865 [Candidatus Portnoybacteria bacterium RIFCSPHIGHO2_12_FULL_38_9]OGZ39354.1 MAG: hypothetical protein A3F21_02725 [Candidatus Portnoybacteria bacterium RIFCSPLOWO2_01_FULL_38_39]OGZ39866.1 MAG: hypothetical protein A3I88_01380 [Candidatus Portnoy
MKSSTSLSKQIKGKYQLRAPRPKKEEQEFGPGEIDILMCQKCEAVYYYKSWHHRLEDYQSLSEDKPRTFSGYASHKIYNPEKARGKRIKFILCPACQMIKDKKYEGRIILKNAPPEKKEEILGLVKNIGERAFQRDPLDRIISIKSKKGDIEILTTENQLAVSIGKQIKRAFKGSLEIQWSHQESIARIIWNYEKI